MAEIEITLPTIQYGNVKIRATPEELGLNDIADSYELGVAAAVYLNLFGQGFRHGATLDVEAPQGAPRRDRVAEAIVEVLADEKAIRALHEGLDGVTEIDSVIEETVTKAAEIEAKAPWDSKVDTKPKPWETGDKTFRSVTEIADLSDW